ncbi:methionine-R-sulfoxide reductase [Pedobacter antarcticus]|uniref:peptide-methionine (R)-S-oxide reductase n=2 Tax=Pedobacter antarcticus TaxID=34086 RepID=A0A081PH06_9SPHI|nr:methionine-R-sulfoxide reductase [Pedobacter antarcticus]KEQ29979.1 methionine sulfoxide reductase B [Pedobacter antarcticus 4BY]SDM04627.1 peptide-methionine (R)-S-oxide reductase [Pedobacter antarcticus]SFF28177.1 peptide-methionine (R)-S-oxide reductase [Pedobacter antarcticus]
MKRLSSIINNLVLFAGFLLLGSLQACAQKPAQVPVKKNTNAMEWNKLTKEEEDVIVRKGTEYPGTGELLNNTAKGTYTCKRCNAPLYRSETKFDAQCGWPSFDDEIKGAVLRIPDADGSRTEIVCANCKAHLGHVFVGEGFTAKSTRHCVNSVSMNFVPDAK